MSDDLMSRFAEQFGLAPRQSKWLSWLWLRVLYTRLLLRLEADKVRDALLNDPCLFNARHYRDYAVMAIHYNTEVNPKAALTADDARRLLEGRLQ